MSEREDFKKFYEAAAQLGFQQPLAAEFIPSADEVPPGQSALGVAFGRLSRADGWIGSHVRSLQNGIGRPTRGPSATI